MSGYNIAKNLRKLYIGFRFVELESDEIGLLASLCHHRVDKGLIPASADNV